MRKDGFEFETQTYTIREEDEEAIKVTLVPIATEDRQWIDVLSKVDLSKDVVDGDWHSTDDGLRIEGRHSAAARLQLPVRVHGDYALFGYATAAELHRTLAWLLIGLWAFAIFWHITTGEWRQYIPTSEKLMAVVRYYTLGIYHPNVEHPFKKTRLSKHNPLQRLAYLFFKLCISPLIWITGLLYLYYNDWSGTWLGFMGLEFVAVMHTAAAYLMLIFFIVHVYLATAGHTPTSHIKAMITGWEEVDETNPSSG